MRSEVCVVVVNYGRPREATELACFSADVVASEYGGAAAVVLVDNSGDVRGEIGSGIELISEGNLGYAGGINSALARLPNFERYLVLTHEVSMGSDDLLALSRPLANGCGGRGAALLNPAGRVWSAGQIWSSRLKRPTHLGDAVKGDASYRVDFVDGSAWCLAGDAVRKVGGLWPDLFLYWEETEWQMRARQHGFFFEVDGTVRVSSAPSGSVDSAYYLLRNELWVRRRHFGLANATVIAAARVAKTFVRALGKSARCGSAEHQWAALQGAIHYFRGIVGPRPRASKQIHGR